MIAPGAEHGATIRGVEGDGRHPAPGFGRDVETALQAVRRAARLCERVAASLRGACAEKPDRSPVTVADLGSQAVICDALLRAFPADAVVAEEDAALLSEPEHAALAARVGEEVAAAGGPASLREVAEVLGQGAGRPAGRRTWILDPIDGTKGFLRGGQYAIALALLSDGALEAAVLACPRLPALSEPGERGVAFVAVRGGGTREVALAGSGAGRPVRVSERADPSALRLCESLEAAHSAHEDAAAVAGALGLCAAPLRLDRQAKYGLLARGEADLYLRMPRAGSYVEKTWDHAAGALVVAEAGGRVTGLAGRPLDFARWRELSGRHGVVATNGAVHAVVLETLVRLGLSGPGG